MPTGTRPSCATGFPVWRGISFSAWAATAVTVSATGALTAQPPPRATTGRVDVTVTTPGGSATLSSAFSYIDEPLLLIDVTPVRVSTPAGTAGALVIGEVVNPDGLSDSFEFFIT